MGDLVAVKFLRPVMMGVLYNEGDIAGFKKELAKQLIDAEAAEAVKVETKAPAK